MEGEGVFEDSVVPDLVLQDPRRDLLEAVFSSLDKTRKGYLTAADMRPFAEQTGFSGSDHEWQEEFALLCRDRGSAKGIKLEEFVQLVNDSSDEGCYCSDSELRALLQQQQQQQQQQPPPSTTPAKAAPVAAKAGSFGWSCAGRRLLLLLLLLQQCSQLAV